MRAGSRLQTKRLLDFDRKVSQPGVHSLNTNEIPKKRIKIAISNIAALKEW